MKIKLKGTLLAAGEAANAINGIVNTAQFTYNVTKGAINWYHNRKHHHSIPLSKEQEEHFDKGGTLECEYACGNVLRARK